MSKVKQKPALQRHKATGQARVRIDGKDHYCGLWGTPESLDEYDRLIREWLLKGDTSGVTLTVDDLAIRYTEHADGYYRKNGEPTSEASNVRIALRPLVKLFGHERARLFGPVKLKAVRDLMIANGCTRTSINRQVGRVCRCFRWAVENELVPADVYHALKAVAGLRKGRSEAVESSPVKPVSAAYVDAIEPHVTRPVWGAIQLQLLTGMRSGEVLSMRGCDLNTTGKIWEYVPSSHKSEHHGRGRVVFLGPQAQQVVKEFLKPDLTAFLFSPADAWDDHLAERRANRKTPITPSQRARKPKENPARVKGERYTPASYGQAIRQACIKANVPHWHPHQLRHLAATIIRREAGLDTARAVLGHASAKITEVYAEIDADKARSIVAKIG